MGIFNSRKHKLPKFPDGVIPLFKQLCAVLDATAVAELRKAVQDALAEHRKQVGKERTFDLRGSEELAERCYFLLDHYQDFPPEKQALITGAVRYFSIAEDPFDERIFSSGFHDDMKVMNYVLEEVGVEDRYLETI